MDIQIKHDQEGQEFTAEVDGDQAELTYAMPKDNVMDFQHTFVPESSRGEGVANQLIEAGLKFAEAQKYQVIASCPAVAAYIRRHQHYQPLLQH